MIISNKIIDENAFPNEINFGYYTPPIPSTWELIDFCDNFEPISANDKKIKQKEYLKEGRFPIIDQGEIFIGGFSDDETKLINIINPVICFGDHTRIFKYLTFSFIPGADGLKIFTPIYTEPKYSFYMCKALKFPNKGYSRHNAYLQKCKFPIPPLAEQRRIVEKIEELFSDIDAGMENLKIAEKQIRQYRQSVLKSAFAGSLIAKNTEWKQVKLGEIVFPRRKRITPNSTNKEMIFIGMDCINPNCLNIHKKYTLKDTKSTAFLFEKNDVLYGRMRSYLNKVFKATFNGAASAEFIVFPENDKLCANFLKYLLHQQDFVKFASRNASGDRPRVGFESDLQQYTFLLPNIDEQQVIVEEIERRFALADEMERAVNESLIQAERLKQSILKEAFSGKLVPQDPNDEPASVLLEKIRLEKANNTPVTKRKSK